MATLKKLVGSIIKFIFHYYFLKSGQHYLASLPIVRWAFRDINNIKTGSQGEIIYLDLGDASGRDIYLFGYNDMKVHDIISIILRPSDSVIDIGANYGSYSLQAARLVGPNGKVHAFEPQPKLAKMLVQSALENNFGHLVVHQLALSDHNGLGTLYTFPPDSGGASLKLAPGQYREKIDVNIVSSADYLKSLSLNKIRLLKIDVESYEFEVLNAAREFFKISPPDYVIFECNDRKTDFWRSPLIRLFLTLGYSRIYEIQKTFFTTKVRNIDHGKEPSTASQNFLAKYGSISERLFD